jgi:hypothetical protein
MLSDLAGNVIDNGTKTSVLAIKFGSVQRQNAKNSEGSSL